MALDPAYDYVLGDLVFQNDFGADPSVPPVDPPVDPSAVTRLMPVTVAAETLTKVNFTFDAHDPAIAQVPEKVVIVYVPYPLAVDPLTAEYALDDANAFPQASADVPVPDPAQATTIAVEYAGAPIYGSRGCQPIYLFRK